MHLELAIQGRLKEFMDANAASIQEGTRKALRRITGGIRTGVRNQIKRGGFAKGSLDRLVVASVKGTDGDAVGKVRSVAIYGQGPYRRQKVDLVRLYSEGATITAAGRAMLAVPTGRGPATRGRGRRWMTPGEMKDAGMETKIVGTTDGKAVVIWQEVVTHVLVPRVTIRKRYDYQQVLTRWKPRLGPVLAQEIDKAAAKRPVLRGR